MARLSGPTEAQRKILAMMAKGAEVCLAKGLHPHCYVRGCHETVGIATMDVLDRRGWVRVKNDDWRWTDYEISDEGRAAIGAGSDG